MSKPTPEQESSSSSEPQIPNYTFKKYLPSYLKSQAVEFYYEVERLIYDKMLKETKAVDEADIKPMITRYQEKAVKALEEAYKPHFERMVSELEKKQIEVVKSVDDEFAATLQRLKDRETEVKLKVFEAEALEIEQTTLKDKQRIWIFAGIGGLALLLFRKK